MQAEAVPRLALLHGPWVLFKCSVQGLEGDSKLLPLAALTPGLLCFISGFQPYLTSTAPMQQKETGRGAKLNSLGTLCVVLADFPQVLRGHAEGKEKRSLRL